MTGDNWNREIGPRFDDGENSSPFTPVTRVKSGFPFSLRPLSLLSLPFFISLFSSFLSPTIVS